MLVVAALVAVFAVQKFLLFGAKGYLITIPQDFQSYYLAAKGLLADANPYDRDAHWDLQRPGDPYFYRFIYPPLALVAAMPFVPFEARTAGIIFLVVNTGLLTFATYRFARLFFDPAAATLLAVVCLGFQPVISSTLIGQINPLVLATVALSYVSWKSDRPWRAGGWLAAGIFVKVTPAVLLAYYLARRQWRVLIASAVWCVGLLALSLLLFGVEMHREFYGILREMSGQVVAAYENQGLNGFLARLMVPTYVTDPLWPKPEWFPLVFRVSAGIVLAVSVAATWRSASADLAFGVMLACALLIAPISWYHTFITLYLALIIALKFALTEEDWSTLTLVLLFCLVFFFHGSTGNLGSMIDVTRYKSGGRTLVLSLPFYALFAAWTCLVIASLTRATPLRSPQPPSPAPSARA